MDKNFLNKALDTGVKILKENLKDFTYKFQYSHSVNNFYNQSENIEWTTGFCTGEYWLAYEHSKDEEFKNSALVQVNSFMDRIKNKIDADHHDMGFLYTPSCVAAYKLVGSQIGKEAGILAADNLLKRFQKKGEFFQAWGELGTKENYRLIIDCLLNLPLLYWATEVTGDKIYAKKANTHAITSLKHLVRDDFSTYHTYFFDNITGEPLEGVTAQGYKNDSAWARGQSWGIYGLALIYPHIKDEKIIELFEKIASFYISRLSEDLIPYWDLDFTKKDNEEKDSSAAVIAACGILEMCKYLEDDRVKYYKNFVYKMTEELIKNYSVKNIKESNGLLLHGVYAKKSPYNSVTNRGVDECNTWGDYFYMELLTRLSKDWDMYW